MLCAGAVSAQPSGNLGNISPTENTLFNNYGRHIENNNQRWLYPPAALTPLPTRKQNFIAPTFITNRTVSMFLSDTFNTVEVMDISCRLLQKQVISGRTGRIDIPLPATASGTCIVRASGKDIAFSQKVLINK